MPIDQSFRSPASFNVISIAGITLPSLVVTLLGRASLRQALPFVNRVCMKMEYNETLLFTDISNATNAKYKK